MNTDNKLTTVSFPLHNHPPSLLRKVVGGVMAAPYRVARYCLIKSANIAAGSISWTVSKIFSGLQGVALRVHDLYHRLSVSFIDASFTPRLFGRVLSLIVTDQRSAEKIAALQDSFKITQKPVFTESAKFLSHYAMEYLKFHLEHAVTLDEINRPSWLQAIVSERGGEKRGYTCIGRVLSSYVANNSEMIGRYIELNILGLFSRLAKFVQELESGNQYILHDLVKTSLEKVTNHFYDCSAKAKPESKDVNEKAIALILSEDEEKARIEFETHFFKALSEALITICLPQGGKELELPMRSVLASYLHDTIYNVLKNEVLPDVLEQGFKEFSKASAKHALFIEVIESIRRLIYNKVDSQSATHQTDYADQAKLEDVVQGCMVGFHYYMNGSKTINYLPQRRLACYFAYKICEKLRHYKLQQFMQDGVEKMLPLLNEGGAWKEEGERKVWVMAPITFNCSLHDNIESVKMMNQRAIERGKQLNALMDKPEQELTQNGGWTGMLFGLFLSVYKKIATADEQNGITRAVVNKMMLPEHEVLAFELTKVAMQTFRVKTKFPERASKPSVKEN